MVKFIRSNLLTPFFSRRPGVHVLLVERRPLDTIESQARVGFGHLDKLDRLVRNDVVDTFLSDWGMDGSTYVERIAVRWCIENILVHRLVADRPQVVTVRYERLIREPGALHDLFERLGLRRPRNLDQLAARPSSTTFRDRHHYVLSPADRNRVEDILAHFGWQEGPEEPVEPPPHRR